MKIVQINITCGNGSTGKICVGISKLLNNNGIENYVLYSIGESDLPNGIKCTQSLHKFQSLQSHILGNYGFNSSKTTKNIIKELDRIQPDVVHLHNLHGHNCNLELLMNYFREKKTRLIWTFHDCWTFTAYCPHFVMAKCEKWKDGCHNCVQSRNFSWFIDRSPWLYSKKKTVFSGLNITIVTPSQWLEDVVKDSFMKEYPVEVIHNGIDTSTFQYTPSEFRKRYGIPEDRYILLGVAIKWVPRKGADVFIRLAQRLDPDKFQIVLVGTDDRIDRCLPPDIISIHRTENQRELAEIYSAADLFVNPTREEVLGLVNLESLACGTPVITYRTGGSPECVDDKSGMVVERNDEEALYRAILKIEAERPFTPEDCRKKALEFSEKEKYLEYLQMYFRS